MKRTDLLWGLVGAVALVGIFYWTQSPAPTEYALKDIEVVQTQPGWEKGLSDRAEIPEDYGMLFIFPKNDAYGFWMKDMVVAIDIIWLSDTGTILAVEQSVSPDTYPSVFYPPEPVRYVLETRAGESTRHGWKPGTILSLPL